MGQCPDKIPTHAFTGPLCRRLALAALAFILVAQTNPATARTPGPGSSQAERVDALFRELTVRQSPGIAIVVVRDGKVVLRRGYGLADLEHRVPISPATVFDAASLAKQFTGFAVATLISEGRLKLSDDVRKYVSESPDFATPITVGHLLHHTSGMRDWPGTLYLAGWRPEDVITTGDILGMAYRQRTLNFEPGTEHLYSNTGYNLLAELVGRVSGSRFPDWIKARLFAPLQMADTRFRTHHGEVIANRALGYERLADGSFRYVANNLSAPGSSSLFSTADDMGRWLVHLGNHSKADSTAMNLLLRPGTLNNGSPVQYAAGLTPGRYRGFDMYTHSGAWGGFNSFFVYMPRLKFGVVALANGSSINAQGAVIDITNIYLEKELEPVAAARSSPVAAPGSSSESSGSPAAGPDRSSRGKAEPLNEYQGIYDSEELMTSYRVVRNGDSLALVHQKHGRIPLARTRNDSFGSTTNEYFRSVVFRRAASGRVIGLTINGDSRSRNIAFVRR